MADLEHKVVEIIDQLQALAAPAMQVAIESTRVMGIAYLVVGVACGFGCYFATKPMPARLKAVRDAESESGEVGNAIALAAFGILAVGLGIATCVNILNPDNWVAAFRPDLYLAQTLLHHL